MVTPISCFWAMEAMLTAAGNDFGFEEVFARPLRGLGRAGDVLFGITDLEQASTDELHGKQGRLFMTTLLDLARRLYDFVIVDMAFTRFGIRHTIRIFFYHGSLRNRKHSHEPARNERTSMYFQRN